MKAYPLVFLLAASVAWANDPSAGGVIGPDDDDDDVAGATAILETATPIVIDGILDEQAWHDATPIPVAVRVGKAGEKSAVVPMTVKYTWDGQYLYIGYETFDTNLVAIGSDVRKGPPGHERQGAEIFKKDAKIDVCEFFVTFGDLHFFWELHHNALNQFNDIWCVTADPAWLVAKSAMATYGILFNRQEYVDDDGASTVAMAVHLKPKADGKPSTINDPSDIDTGYTAEIRLPWKSIGAPASAQTLIKPAAKGDPRLPGPWKMAGHTMNLLAVVQDGDLKDRYHHDGTGPVRDWFHKAQDVWPIYEFKRAPGSPRSVIAELMERTDANDVPASLEKEASDFGVVAAVAGAEFLDEHKPARAQVLYEVMTPVGNARRTHAELLRLYQPEAFRLFYTPEGIADQRKIGVALTWKKWPASLPEAAVGIAPVPLIEWLNAQAKAPKPALDKLASLTRPLGWWLRIHSERQYEKEFREAIAALSSNAAITADPASCVVLLTLIADARAGGSVDFVSKQCESASSDVRAAAAVALGRLAADDPSAAVKALDAFVRLAASEQDATVLTRLATASEAWLDEPKVGQAMLDVYRRSTDTNLRRTILYAVGKTKWPQRGAIIKVALEQPGGGVVGVALDALSLQPVPELADTVYEMISGNDEAQPDLIDVAGAYADERYAPMLLRWLKTEKNIGIQLKLVRALEKTPGAAVSQVLADQLAQTADPFMAGQLCRVASHRDLPAAVSVLVALAEDTTAPMIVRGQAVWALGRYTTPVARESLAKLRREPETFFKTAEGAALVPENLAQVRLYLALAALRQGDAAAETEVRQCFTDGTPAVQLSCMMALAEIRRDDPLIAVGLTSTDFASLQGAVQAAALANPAAYHERLVALEKSPWVTALVSSGLDVAMLRKGLDYALHQRGANP